MAFQLVCYYTLHFNNIGISPANFKSLLECVQFYCFSDFQQILLSSASRLLSAETLPFFIPLFSICPPSLRAQLDSIILPSFLYLSYRGLLPVSVLPLEASNAVMSRLLSSPTLLMANHLPPILCHPAISHQFLSSDLLISLFGPPGFFKHKLNPPNSWSSSFSNESPISPIEDSSPQPQNAYNYQQLLNNRNNEATMSHHQSLVGFAAAYLPPVVALPSFDATQPISPKRFRMLIVKKVDGHAGHAFIGVGFPSLMPEGVRTDPVRNPHALIISLSSGRVGLGGVPLEDISGWASGGLGKKERIYLAIEDVFGPGHFRSSDSVVPFTVGQVSGRYLAWVRRDEGAWVALAWLKDETGDFDADEDSNQMASNILYGEGPLLMAALSSGGGGGDAPCLVAHHVLDVEEAAESAVSLWNMADVMGDAFVSSPCKSRSEIFPVLEPAAALHILQEKMQEKLAAMPSHFSSSLSLLLQSRVLHQKMHSWKGYPSKFDPKDIMPSNHHPFKFPSGDVFPESRSSSSSSSSSSLSSSSSGFSPSRSASPPMSNRPFPFPASNLNASDPDPVNWLHPTAHAEQPLPSSTTAVVSTDDYLFPPLPPAELHPPRSNGRAELLTHIPPPRPPLNSGQPAVTNGWNGIPAMRVVGWDGPLQSPPHQRHAGVVWRRGTESQRRLPNERHSYHARSSVGDPMDIFENTQSTPSRGPPGHIIPNNTLQNWDDGTTADPTVSNANSAHNRE